MKTIHLSLVTALLCFVLLSSGCWQPQQSEETPIEADTNQTIIVDEPIEELNEHVEGTIPFHLSVAGINFLNAKGIYSGVFVGIDNNVYGIYRDGAFQTHEIENPHSWIEEDATGSRCNMFVWNEDPSSIHTECLTTEVIVNETIVHIGTAGYTFHIYGNVEYLHNSEHGHYQREENLAITTFEVDKKKYPQVFVDSDSGAFFGDGKVNDYLIYVTEGTYLDANNSSDGSQAVFRSLLETMEGVSDVADYYEYRAGNKLQMEYRVLRSDGVTSRDFLKHIEAGVKSIWGIPEVNLFPKTMEGAAVAKDYLVAFGIYANSGKSLLVFKIAPYEYLGAGNHFVVN